MKEVITMEEKKIHVPSLVLMIVGFVFSLISPIVTYVCSIISIIMSIKNRKINKTTYAIILNIIALLIAAANHIYAIIMTMNKI